MGALKVILIIFAVLFLFFAQRIKIHVKLDEVFRLRAGLGPFVFTITPRRKKQVKASDYTYEKHRKRLEKNRKKAEAKAAKKREKQKAKATKKKAEAAESAVKKAEQAKEPEEKLASITEIISLALDELSSLASYTHTDIRSLVITVGSDDAAKTAKTYGAISGGVSLLLELLAHKTAMKKMKPDTVRISADFLAPKTKFKIDIRIELTLFSILRLGGKAIAWFIKQKTKSAAAGNDSKAEKPEKSASDAHAEDKGSAN